ncbi:MAG: hypothetical protein K0Q51_946 [Rickettsiaceae bacterium]|jgi:glycerol-3-phosphate dehydrogenase (NAD(P)+)|nr:hypothetical protein [Rickettsiaceae bacterium]
MLNTNIDNIAIIGGGAWATALAIQLSKKQEKCTLYLRNKDIINEINTQHTNNKYLPNIILPSNLIASSDISSIDQHQAIIIAVPSIAFKETLNKIKENNSRLKNPIIIATKGLDQATGKLMTDIAAEILPSLDTAILSGPNLAYEIACSLPASINIACTNLNTVKNIAEALETDSLVTSLSTDIVTPQISGAIKNIVAVMAGIFDALKYGHNAKAFLLTQGLKEIRDLSLLLGGNIDSCFNVSAIGDLSLGINAMKSRNYNFGLELISSNIPEELIANYPYLVEGINACKAIELLINKHNIKLPLSQTVIDILNNPFSLKSTLRNFKALAHA